MFGIIFCFLLFIGMMVSLAVIASNAKQDLVVTDYYKAELAYQEQIDKIENVNALKEKPQLVYDSIANQVQIIFPASVADQGIDGLLSFYRPDKPEKDFTIPLQLGQDNVQRFPLNTLLKGKWKLQLNWSSQERQYYNSTEISIK